MLTTEPLRPELETLPYRLRSLPVFRGYPVPWFVAWPNGPDGEPEFRAADGEKWTRAVREKLCWVCGERLGRNYAFVLGPMCGINRTTAEPPCHFECATWSCRNCPFLSKPYMKRREDEELEAAASETVQSGHMIKRNPGAVLVWVTRSYELFDDGKGGILIRVGKPDSLEWFAEGKKANRAQVVRSIDTGLPLLEALCEGRPGDLKHLHEMRDVFMGYVPRE